VTSEKRKYLIRDRPCEKRQTLEFYLEAANVDYYFSQLFLNFLTVKNVGLSSFHFFKTYFPGLIPPCLKSISLEVYLRYAERFRFRYMY